MTIGPVSYAPSILALASTPDSAAGGDATAETDGAVEVAHLVLDAVHAQGAMVSSLLASTATLGQHLDVRV